MSNTSAAFNLSAIMSLISKLLFFEYFRTAWPAARLSLFFGRSPALDKNQVTILRLVHQIENACGRLEPLLAPLCFPICIGGRQSLKQTFDERMDCVLRLVGRWRCERPIRFQRHLLRLWYCSDDRHYKFVWDKIKESCLFRRTLENLSRRRSLFWYNAKIFDCSFEAFKTW